MRPHNWVIGESTSVWKSISGLAERESPSIQVRRAGSSSTVSGRASSFAAALCLYCPNRHVQPERWVGPRYVRESSVSSYPFFLTNCHIFHARVRSRKRGCRMIQWTRSTSASSRLKSASQWYLWLLRMFYDDGWIIFITF